MTKKTKKKFWQQFVTRCEELTKIGKLVELILKIASLFTLLELPRIRPIVWKIILIVVANTITS